MKTRIISAVAALAILLVVLILHKTFVYPVCIGLISAMAVLELFKADHCTKYSISLAAGVLAAIATPILRFYALHGWDRLIFTAMVLVMCFDFVRHHKERKFHQLTFMLAASLLVPYSMNLLVTLKQMSPKYGLMYVILALAAAWISDTGAYFTGTFFGKTKLCPEISPKKTVEGFFGGIVVDIAVMIVVSLIYGWIADVKVQFLWLIFTAAICSVAGVLGDLSASLLKRQRNIKDFGKIMPGHGGVMDRFDSALFTVPVFYACVCAIPIYSL